MKTKIIIASIVTVVLLAVTFKLKSNKRTVEENIYRPDLDKRVLVEAQLATLKNVDKSLHYTGTFAAAREVMLIPQIHGEVKSVYFHEGDHVKAGKTLIQIDDDLLQAQYMAADASYQTAKRNLERHQSAAASGGVSKLQLDNFLLSLKSAESTLRQLIKQIELSKIIAPFTGTITLRDVEPGSVVAGSPVARITDLTQLKLEVSVPEKEVILFKEGKQAQVTSDVYPGHTFAGTIEYVADRADNSHNYNVRILIQNNDADKTIKAGMYGTVVLDTDLNKEALFIPRAALLGSAKNPQVFVIHNDKAILRDIQTGSSNNELVEVLNGLQDGEVVATSGHINLANGSNVTVSK
ncbi:MAG: efflux transporter periplasmic adaptor subunit [Marivirga sp.]|nr:efflux transporter periplasmic adaptor subunit [Marivirga sp.]